VRGHWFVTPVGLSVAGSAQEYSREMFFKNLKRECGRRREIPFRSESMLFSGTGPLACTRLEVGARFFAAARIGSAIA